MKELNEARSSYRTPAQVEAVSRVQSWVGRRLVELSRSSRPEDQRLVGSMLAATALHNVSAETGALSSDPVTVVQRWIEHTLPEMLRSDEEAERGLALDMIASTVLDEIAA